MPHVFSVTNIKLARGDTSTDAPPRPGDNPNRRPETQIRQISFEIAGRQWNLEDVLFQQSISENDKRKPLCSGQLSTEYPPGEDPTPVDRIADDISFLLSFAIGRDIHWVIRKTIDIGDKVVSERYRSIYVEPFGRGGLGPIQNWEAGSLRMFIEAAYPKFAEKKEWWSRTLDYCLQARISTYAEIKSAILNILLDRISIDILANPPLGSQIDDNLEARLKPNFHVLHNVFRELSTKWKELHTEKVINKIKEFNSRPSFPEQIHLAFERLDLNPPGSGTISARHKLLHIGELKPKDDDLPGYCKELDYAVTMMILRRLNYEGRFFHDHLAEGFANVAAIVSETRAVVPPKLLGN